MEKRKITFMYVTKNGDPEKHSMIVPSPEHIEMNIVAVKDIKQAEEVAKKLITEGTKIIELCGGFGHQGVAKIVKAVQGRAKIGVVRFDCHPALSGNSGDDIYL